MFARVTDVKYKDKVYQYLRLVESYRDRRGKVRQRIVWIIGRLDKLLEEGKLEEIIEELRKFCPKKFLVPGETCNKESVCWGPVLVARRLWEEVDEKNIEAELVREGRYILTINHPHIPAEEAVAHYKELCDIEAGFREFKDVIQGRPVYHQRDDRICAHLFIAQLALLLFRQLRYHLNQKDISLSPGEALAAVKSVGVAVLDLNGNKQPLVSRPKPHASRVLTALGITDLQPPGSARKKRTSAARKKAM